MSDTPPEPPDPTAFMEFDVDPDDIFELAKALEEAEVFDPEEVDDERLARFVSGLKSLENAAEDARKEVFEAALADRVSEGQVVWDVRKATGSNRYVTDHEGAFDAVLEAGQDPRDVAKVSAPKLEEVIGSELAQEYIGESEYEYFRRER